MDPNTVLNVLGTWGYPALLVLLILNGLGSPIPEDLLLLTAGYLVFAGVFEWRPVLVISATGVVVSDFMLYSAGRHLAWRVGRASDANLLSARSVQWATRWLGRLGHVVILIARLIPGTRALVFVTAGAQAVPVSSFLRYDILGAAIWVPVVLIVGHGSGDRVGDLGDAISWAKGGALWAIAIAAALLVMWLRWGRAESKP